MQQGGRRHDLACLAVAALGHIDCFPSHLYRVLAIRRKPFNGGHRLATDTTHRRLAGAHRLAANDDRARPAKPDAAAVLGAFDVQYIAQHPQERHIRWHVHRRGHVVDSQFGEHRFTPGSGQQRIGENFCMALDFIKLLAPLRGLYFDGQANDGYPPRFVGC